MNQEWDSSCDAATTWHSCSWSSMQSSRAARGGVMLDWHHVPRVDGALVWEPLVLRQGWRPGARQG